MGDTQLVVLGDYNGVAIQARPSDTFVDVTEMCRSNGREWWRYRETQAAKCFIAALSASLAVGEVGLICETRDENGQRGHTFADRRVALHCAAWCDRTLSRQRQGMA